MSPTDPEPGRSPAGTGQPPEPGERQTTETLAPGEREPWPPPSPGERPPSTASAAGERRPAPLDRPPGERYLPAEGGRPGDDRLVWPPLAVAVGGVFAYTVLGGLLSITAGLIVVGAFVGWLLGNLITGPSRAALAAVATVMLGLVGVWLFGRLEGGDLDPVSYLDAVQGWPLVGLQLLAAAGVAAASSR